MFGKLSQVRSRKYILRQLLTFPPHCPLPGSNTRSSLHPTAPHPISSYQSSMPICLNLTLASFSHENLDRLHLIFPATISNYAEKVPQVMRFLHHGPIGISIS